MKIIFLSQYSGVNPRGAETFVYELGNRLHNYGFNVAVFQNGAIQPGTAFETIRVSETSPLKFTLRSLKMINDSDVIIPTNGRIQAVVSRIWAKCKRVKVIISGQSGIGWDDKLNLLCFPDIFIGLTNHQVKWAKKINPLINFEKIPNGVDLVKFKPGKSTIKINLPQPVIINTGALTPIKRQDLMIYAVAKTTASLVIIGKGPLYSQLMTLGQRLLSGRFLIQQYEYSKMPDVYRLGKLFVYPCADYESFGIAILEAMATNLPVIVNNDPIRREIVGLGGDFVNPRDQFQFSNVISNSLIKKWGNIPRIQAQKYSWDLIAEKYIKILKKL